LITSFGNQATADLFNGINSRNSRKISSEITQKALNKLDILNAVEKLDELKNPPGNRLEALKGNLKGFYRTHLVSQETANLRNKSRRKQRWILVVA
jgi:proteic killer suppression protein